MHVAVAMSGGVDSSVAAAMLVEAGHRVVGVHMDLSPEVGSADLARAAAEQLGIPLQVVDLRDVFQVEVVDYLVGSYLSGLTPNPCVRCNARVKLGALLEHTLRLGASHLATGHYARIGPGPSLHVAADRAKDQTYFLHQVGREVLERVVFPLGDTTKDAVRERAATLGLTAARRPESQEICFVPDDDHFRFIGARGAHGAGDIVDEAGVVLGRHQGFYRYTVGQRRGLGVALGAPAYVVEVQPETRRVVVTTDPDRLLARGLALGDCRWYELPVADEVVEVQVRYRGRRIRCRVELDEGRARVELEEPARALAPGQSAVFYRGDLVLGGGVILGREGAA